MGFFDRISQGLQRSRDKFKEEMNVLLDRGPDLDEEFWDGLEETLILADIGGAAACDIVENLRDQATRKALPDAYAVLDMLNDQIADTFTQGGQEILGGDPACVLFVGINGTGKTTTVGKLSKEAHDAGRKVILGSADTFRAAAIEQLEVWANRADVEMVTRERGADPASVCYDTIERAEAEDADLVLIDTAGRLHTSADLMRELAKVVNVVRKRSKLPVYTVLVIDATTGQNGLQQAREFNRELELDALIVTKLDGTAKGGIAVAVSHELGLPILRVGVGEGIEDLQPFEPREYAEALFGEMRDEVEGKDESVPVVDTCPGTGEGRFEDVEEAPEVETEAGDELVEAQLEPEEELAEAETEPETDDEEYEDGVEIWLEVDDGSEDDEVDEFEDESAFDEGDADDEIDAEPVDEDDSEPAKESFRDKMRRWFS